MNIHLIQSQIKPLNEKLKRALDNTLLFATGIVNPFGPTLDTYFINEQKKILRIHLHPLNTELSIVGEVAFEENSTEISNVWINKTIFEGRFFSLFLVGLDFEYSEFYDFFFEISMLNAESSSEQLRLIKRHPGDPYKRVSEEIDLGMKQAIEEQKDPKKKRTIDPKNIPEKEISEHFKLLTIQEYIRKEMVAFSFAWQGSIDHMGVGSLVKLDFDEFNYQIFPEIVVRSNLDLSYLKK